jgi:ABC-type lipoprotein export system ATPase subunit
MKIEFINVMPKPLAGFNHSEESLWGNTVVFDSKQKSLLNASSGKGKTTFTHCLMGLRSDFSGEILLNGENTKSIDLEKWVEIRQRKIAVVFQDLQLFPRLTVEENLKLKVELTGVFDADRTFEKIDFVGLADKWNQKCGLLSMGQQQRVAIIRGLIQPFDCIVLDEPFSHLDKENASKCMQLILERCEEQNAGFILTTLDVNEDVLFDKEIKL